MYLAWFDANPKKPIAQKIAEAHQRFVEKFNRQPLVCLINPRRYGRRESHRVAPIAIHRSQLLLDRHR